MTPDSLKLTEFDPAGSGWDWVRQGLTTDKGVGAVALVRRVP